MCFTYPTLQLQRAQKQQLFRLIFLKKTSGSGWPKPNQHLKDNQGLYSCFLLYKKLLNCLACIWFGTSLLQSIVWLLHDVIIQSMSIPQKNCCFLFYSRLTGSTWHMQQFQMSRKAVFIWSQHCFLLGKRYLKGS